MKIGWILVFFVISLFFISGQTGCETLNTNLNQLGQNKITPSSLSSGNGLNVNVEPIGTIKEDKGFNVYVNLVNKGRAVEPTIKIWDLAEDLGAVPDEEKSISLRDAMIDGKIEPQKEFVIFGPYKYTNLKADVGTTLFVEVNSNYDVSITPPKGLCISRRESKDCKDESISETGEHSEIISGGKLGDEAGLVPITVTNIEKTYRSLENIVDLELLISLSDSGQGSGSNNIINNFEVDLGGTRLDCGISNSIDIQKLKGPIICDTEIDIGEKKAQSLQLTVSFNYGYSIIQNVPISIINKDESLT